MMIMAIEQVQRELAQLVDDVALGEHIVITRNGVPVAQLTPIARPTPKPTFGSAKGLVKMAEDFDAPVDDFRHYMR